MKSAEGGFPGGICAANTSSERGQEEQSMHHALFAALLCGLSVSATAAPIPSFDPREHRAPVAGKPTEVMVLGSPHISGLPKSFDPANLSLLVDRLAAWKPDRVLVEGLSGQQCDMLRRYKAQIPDAAET
jgi:hypothetical protein